MKNKLLEISGVVLLVIVSVAAFMAATGVIEQPFTNYLWIPLRICGGCWTILVTYLFFTFIEVKQRENGGLKETITDIDRRENYFRRNNF